jgi:predicted ATPase
VIVERVERRAYAEGDEPPLRGWPFDLAPVAQVLREGLRLDRPVTFLVGENGSGKSTLIEAIAEAYGVDLRGGHIGRDYATGAEKSPLAQELRLRRTKVGRRMVGTTPRGYFLRAETAYGFFEVMSGSQAYGGYDLMRLSHGESFLAVFDTRFDRPGPYLMDEHESALSFTSCLKLLALIGDIVERGSQVICATHSPLLAALPGAQILEIGEHGIRVVAWQDLQLVDHWRRFLSRPDVYLRHLTDD